MTAEKKQHALDLLEQVGLVDRANSFPDVLSGGEKQRVSLVRAVVHKPPYLLADEPTGNLDPALSEEIMKLFAAFNQVGVTVLIASHDLELISHMNHRVIEISKGRILNSGGKH